MSEPWIEVCLTNATEAARAALRRAARVGGARPSLSVLHSVRVLVEVEDDCITIALSCKGGVLHHVRVRRHVLRPAAAVLARTLDVLHSAVVRVRDRAVDARDRILRARPAALLVPKRLRETPRRLELEARRVGFIELSL